mmetsp:Transcript_24613/g.67637  ORF Transcript_24613/g.67637 Transcript_24613/m.67637 type:complete len:109 (-) Transcript_24613:1893-2219(-)|eukprot:scaffold223932_cov32-Tisochrysis_lutea.AAC.2
MPAQLAECSLRVEERWHGVVLRPFSREKGGPSTAVVCDFQRLACEEQSCHQGEMRFDGIWDDVAAMVTSAVQDEGTQAAKRADPIANARQVSTVHEAVSYADMLNVGS